MVDLVWASAKKIDFTLSNQLRIGLQHFKWLNLQHKTKQVKPWFYNLPPAGLAGVNPRGCAEKFIKAQY